MTTITRTLAALTMLAGCYNPNVPSGAIHVPEPRRPLPGWTRVRGGDVSVPDARSAADAGRYGESCTGHDDVCEAASVRAWRRGFA